MDKPVVNILQRHLAEGYSIAFAKAGYVLATIERSRALIFEQKFSIGEKSEAEDFGSR